MSKRFGLLLAALLVAALLLTACDTGSSDAGKDYMEAVMKGDEAAALDLACDNFQDQTQQLVAFYGDQGLQTDSIDLKYDIGKAGNTHEVIVTGSYNYGDPEMPREWVLSEKKNTRVILDMEKSGGDWCVSDGSVFEGVAALGGGAPETAETDMALPGSEETPAAPAESESSGQ